MDKIRVRYFPYQAHCFAFGGFELQMLSAYNSVIQRDNTSVNLTKIDLWSRDDDFAVAHFWGFGLANYENIVWAKKAGKTVIVTALFGYYETLLSKIKHYVSSLTYVTRILKTLVQYIDRVVVVNEAQREVAVDYWGFSREKIHIIPNIVKPVYFEKNSTDVNLPFREYVLCVGNVCVRKNQVRLMQAFSSLKHNLVIIGRILPGEKAYIENFHQTLSRNKNIHFIEGLEEGSNDLSSIVKNCSAFVLPSFSETQPISLLEAAAAGRPLLISNLVFAYQKYYQNAKLINPRSVRSISMGIESVLQSPGSYIPPAEYIHECTEEFVGGAYKKLYENACK